MQYTASCRMLLGLSLLVILSACSFGMRTSRARLLPYEQNTVNVAKQYKSSVVAIDVTAPGKRVNPLQGGPFFHQFGGGTQQRPETERAAGSGFVVDRQGQILTNYHVVSGALEDSSTQLMSGASLTVQFPGGHALPAQVVGVDQSHDLALLRLKKPSQRPADAKPIPLADSGHVRVGEKAIAIGNPFRLQSTVTQGIVSGVNRERPAKISGVPIQYIQTDAPVEPGSSGSPLLDSQGQVIGVTDEIIAANGAFIGVGLAVPSNLVKHSLPRMQAGGFIKKARIGVLVEALAHYPKVVRGELHLPDRGLMVVFVEPHSPGAKAGLTGAQFTVDADGQPWPAGGDVILKVNGKRTNDTHALQKIVFSKKAGNTIHLVVLHSGKRHDVNVKLQVLKHKNTLAG